MNGKQLILVVDDDHEILRMVNRLFELEGYDVITAADGKCAMALMKEREPDLIVLDIMMPELNGFQVLDLVRQHSDIPIIMLTARSEVTTLHNALALGADDYIKKPFHTRELLARVRAKLRRGGSGVSPPGASGSVAPGTAQITRKGE